MLMQVGGGRRGRVGVQGGVRVVWGGGGASERVTRVLVRGLV